jgi:hypothetical protein
MIEGNTKIRISDTRELVQYKTNAYIGYKKSLEARFGDYDLVEAEEIIIAKNGKIMDYKEFLSEECAAWIRFCIKDVQRFCSLPEFVTTQINDEIIFIDTIDGKLWQKGIEQLNGNIFEAVMIDKSEYPNYYEGVINTLLDICPIKLEKIDSKKETFGHRLVRTFF